MGEREGESICCPHFSLMAETRLKNDLGCPLLSLTLNIRIIDCSVVVALHQYATKSVADVGDISEIAGAKRIVVGRLLRWETSLRWE